MKPIFSILFFLSLLPIIYFVSYKKDLNQITFYYLTTITLLIGMAIYPINWKFKELKDIIFISVILYLLFLILNVFLIKVFVQKFALINLLTAMFCYFQYWIYRKKK